MRVEHFGLMVAYVGCFVVALSSTAIAGNYIDWEIKNRYRAFDYKATGIRTPAESAAELERYSPKTDENLQDWLNRIVTIPSPFLTDSGPWREADGVYERDFLDLPKHIFLKAQLVSDTYQEEYVEQKECSWQISGREAKHLPCKEPILVPDFDSRGEEVSVFRDGVKVASQFIKPTLKIILGLGDSYGSGEGNPDSPTVWRKPEAGEWPPTDETATNKLVLKPARWSSNRCDRSFYSYQNLVALRTAFDNPQAVVAFVHLACSGAEVIDGLLAPQRYPPGYSTHRCVPPQQRFPSDRLDPECDVRYSQLNAAIALLCHGQHEPLSFEKISAVKEQLGNIRHNKKQRQWLHQEGLQACTSEHLREIDYVLLSIGGNDIGFSGLIAHALMPSRSRINIWPFNNIAKWIVRMAQKEGNAVCPYTPAEESKKRECGDLGMAADLRINEIPSRYEALSLALSYALPIAPQKIIVNLYPNPLTNQEGQLCNTDAAESESNNAWHATHVLLPSNWFYNLFKLGEWQINLTAGEARDVESHDIDPLNNRIKQKAEEFGWQVVHAQHSMNNRGWCTGQSVKLLPANELTSWSPYKPNTRFIRTANDSFLTQWPSTESEKELPDTNLNERENGFNGTFHPNAQGHAAIAERVILQMRKMALQTKDLKPRQ